MSKRYAIWDKKTPIITPIYEVLSPEQWMERYPAAAIESITVLCSAGEVNGGFFGTLSQMVQMYEAQGADFANATTAEEKLEVIEAFEDAREAEAKAAAEVAKANEELNAMSLASIAANMEYQNMMTLPDEEA